jgi:hypothetical protein
MIRRLTRLINAFSKKWENHLTIQATPACGSGVPQWSVVVSFRFGRYGQVALGKLETGGNGSTTKVSAANR